MLNTDTLKKKTEALYSVSKEKLDFWYESLYRPFYTLEEAGKQTEQIVFAKFAEATENLYTLSEACEVFLTYAKEMKEKGIEAFYHRIPLIGGNGFEKKILRQFEVRLQKILLEG